MKKRKKKKENPTHSPARPTATLAKLIAPRLQNESKLTPSRMPWTRVFPWRNGKETNVDALPPASLNTALCEGILCEARVAMLGYAGVSQGVH